MRTHETSVRNGFWLEGTQSLIGQGVHSSSFARSSPDGEGFSVLDFSEENCFIVVSLREIESEYYGMKRRWSGKSLELRKKEKETIQVLGERRGHVISSSP